MITRVAVENFGCARSVNMTLKPLTLLVGPNASGKSTLLRAFAGLSNPSSWRNEPLLAKISAFDESDVEAHVLHWSLGTGLRGEPWVRTQLLQLDLQSLRSPNHAGEAQRLAERGENLTNVVASLGRKTMDKLAQQLCLLVPVFRDFDVRPVGGGNQTLRFQDAWDSQRWYRPNEVSDGTMLLLAFLVLQYQTPPPDLILIEEPERGLHPYLLTELVKILRKLVTGELGKPIQVVMATHSAELLDRVEPDEVRFISRSPDDGGIVVEQIRTDDPQWPAAFEEYRKSLSETWLSGAVGGVP